MADPEEIAASVSTTRSVQHELQLKAVPAGVVIKVCKDGVDQATYTVPEGKKFTGTFTLTGSEEDA